MNKEEVIIDRKGKIKEEGEGRSKHEVYWGGGEWGRGWGRVGGGEWGRGWGRGGGVEVGLL
jgi:hypothetical protein